MKPEIKTQLIAALRSGDYQQGFGALNKQGCHCFGGVLCDLAVKAGVAQWKPSADPDMFRCNMNGEWGGTGTVPLDVLNWAECHNTLPYKGFNRNFYELNDGEHLTFAQFADLLESMP